MSVFPCSTDLFPSPLCTHTHTHLPPPLCTSKEKGGRRRYLLAHLSLFRLCSLSFPYCQRLEPCARVQHREPMPWCFNEKAPFFLYFPFSFFFACFSRSTTTRTLHHTPRNHVGESGSGLRSVSSPHRCCSSSPLLPPMALFSLQLIRRHRRVFCAHLTQTQTHNARVHGLLLSLLVALHDHILPPRSRLSSFTVRHGLSFHANWFPTTTPAYAHGRGARAALER